MISHLVFFLLFETFQPSYGTLIGLLPANVVISARAHPAASGAKMPIKKGISTSPVVDAQSIFAFDRTAGAPLFIRNIFERRPMASIAKLVTAMVILDHHALDEKTVVSHNAATQEGSKMGLKSGEEITVESLLTGLLVDSGNDAATALAEFDADTEENFVIKMNEKAQTLNLMDTNFSNAKGFDEPGNYSTAADVMTFSLAALEYPFIRKTVSIKTGEVTSASGKTKHPLESTNELLENPYFNVVGLKTGSTPEAGQSFVSLLKAPAGHEVLTVVLASPNRFKETKILLDWILRNFEFS
ncbi:MAG: hypothetical protein AAB588_02985 [Patescibacteria group bacterium]